ncbi:hypothetical protein [Streptomyces enissocaesilis]|uniref:Transglycosylase SLT domain-containing protein n=1 Tax=Streptomyces enissocaesilis TaxID=332589 RepID=A0ABN3X9Q3_9ACTN
MEPACGAETDAGGLPLPEVTHQDPGDDSGECAMRAYARRACEPTGMGPEYGVPALVTIALRESACDHPRRRVNTTDSNAHGPVMADGHPRNCSRGATRCIPPAFAAYHQEGIATTPYDVVARMCATINHVRARYGVDRSGSGFAERVQQADPGRPPRGYRTGLPRPASLTTAPSPSSLAGHHQPPVGAPVGAIPVPPTR